MLLQNKVIIVTGGTEGIGLECAKAYIAEGAIVHICGRNEERGIAALETLEQQAYFHPCDVSQGDDVKRTVESVLSISKQIDVIHNNAGIASPAKPIDQTEENEWNALVDINLKSVYWTTKYGIEALKETQGNILNTSSMVGIIGQENHAAYTATKGGMNTLTQSMALDYAPFGIRVNAVCPAGTWTPMLRQWCREQPDPGSIENYLDEIHPLGYCPEGDVIADASVFLVSDKARFVTGCIMPVSGGAELGYRRVN